MEKEREEFFRFFTLVQENGRYVLRYVIKTLYNQDRIPDFEQFLNYYKHPLFHKWIPNKHCCPGGGGGGATPTLTCNYKSEPNKNPVFTKHQWKQLYQQPRFSSIPLHGPIGECPCKWSAITAKDIEDLDVTLLCQILNIVYSTRLSVSQVQAVEYIKNERNNLAHPSKKLKIDSFEKRWESLKQAIMELAKCHLQPDQQENLKKDIENLNTRSITLEDFEKLLDDKLQQMRDGFVEDVRTIFENSGICKQNNAKKFKPDPEENGEHWMDMTFKSQFDDIRKTQNLISESIKTVSDDIKEKLRPFITEFNELKEHFEDCTPDKIEDCHLEYTDLVDTRGKVTLEACWKELEEKYLIKYKEEDYEALDENDWTEIKALEYPKSTIEKKNERRKVEINEKLQRAAIEEHVCRTPECDNEIRIVIVGKTGVGKSALGNLLLQNPGYFTESSGSKSETAKVKEGSRKFGNRKIRVLDTPGLFDTDRSLDEVKTELAKCVLKFKDGFHAMAVVLNGSNLKYTPEEQKAVTEIKNIFGKSIMEFCFVVITHMGGIKKDITAQQFVDEIEQKEFKDLVHKSFGKRLMFVENTASSLYEQNGFITVFIGMVDNIHKNLKKKIYTDDLFKDAKRISEDTEKEEKDRKEQQLKSEMKKVADNIKYLRNAVEEKVRKLFSKKTKDEVRNMNGDDDLKMEENIKISVTAKLEEKRKEFIERFPDTNLMSTICSEMIEKEKKRKLGHEKSSETENDYVVLDDVSLKVDEQKVVTVLFRELHEKVENIIENYFKNITPEKLKSMENEEVASADIEQLSEKVREKLSADANKYLAKETIKEEVQYKVNKEKDKLTKVGKTTETKLKSPEGGQSASAVCFPADAVIYTLRGAIFMSDIRIGDMVLTYDSKTKLPRYEDVIMLSHAEHNQITEMIQITVSCSDKIILSPGHFVHLNYFENLVPARLVKKGDNLCVYAGESFVWTEVINVCSFIKRGLFCPHTVGGSVVVNGVLASCGTEQVSKYVTNTSMYVVKLLYQYLPSVVFKAMYGKNREQDVPYLLTKLRPLYFETKNIKIAS